MSPDNGDVGTVDARDQVSAKATMLSRAKKALGPDISIVDKPSENSRVYEREDGSFVLHTVNNRQSHASEKQNYEDTDSGPMSTYRYGESSPYNYWSDSYGVGLNEEFSSVYQNETFRASAQITGLSAVPNYSEVLGVDVEISTDDFGINSIRHGTIELREYNDGLSTSPGTKEDFEAIGSGVLYDGINIDSDYFTGQLSFSSTSNIATQIESVTQNGGDDFRIGLKATDESEEGVLVSVSYVDVFVEYSVKPSKPSIIEPVSGSSVNTLDVTLEWGNAGGNPSPEYTVELADNPSLENSQAKTTSGTSTTFSNLTENQTYYWRVIASNSAGADTSETASFTVDLLPTINISGPTYVEHGTFNTWTTNVENAEGSINYQWYVKEIGSSSFNSAGTSSSHTDRFYNDTGEVRPVEIRVDITSAGESASETLQVGVSAGGCDPSEFFC